MGKTIEQQIAELVETARPTPELPPERRDQALAAMEAAGRRPRHVWIWRLSAAAAAGAIVVAIALLGSPARSAWDTVAQVRDRALAAADEAETVHIYGVTPWLGRDVPGHGPEVVETDKEMWADRNGFSRMELRTRDGGQLFYLDLYNGMERVSYCPRQSSDDTSNAHRYWDPEEAQASRGRMQQRVKMQIRRDFSLLGEPDEYRRAAVTHGAVDVLEAESVAWHEDLHYDLHRGEKLRLRAEVDPQTGRLVTLTVFTFNAPSGTWEVKSESHYEWNVPIPGELRTFDIPKGTLEHRYHWWDTRADQVLAQKQTENWTVAVRALDANRSGAVYLSLSAAPNSSTTVTPAESSVVEVKVDAVDDRGVVYQADAEYVGLGTYLGTNIGFPVVLLRPAGESTGRVLTITVHPYMAAGQGQDPMTPDEPVSFRLPLPPRQDCDDVAEDGVELVQH
jgi:hypothetical protein